MSIYLWLSAFSEIVSAVTLFLTDMIWTVLLRDFKLVLTVRTCTVP